MFDISLVEGLFFILFHNAYILHARIKKLKLKSQPSKFTRKKKFPSNFRAKKTKNLNSGYDKISIL